MTAFDEYTLRRERWHAVRSAQERLFILIGNWRLVVGIVEAVVAYYVFFARAWPWWMLLPALAVFVALAAWHAQVLRQKTLAKRAIAFYDGSLARLQNRWQDNANTGEQFREPEHVYAEDLDLFGKGSLFQLLATARTKAGEQNLARWLLGPASTEEVLGRQSAIRELTEKLDLREDLALLGRDVQAGLDLAAIRRWGTAPPVQFAPALRWVAALLATASVVCLVAFFGQQMPLAALLGVLFCDAVLIFYLRQRVKTVLDSVDTPAHGLQIFALVLERLEQEPFQSAHLQKLLQAMRMQGPPASARIRSLGRCMDWFDSSDHLLVKAIQPMVLWREQIAMAIEAWRRESGSGIGPWLQAVADFETLSSLASIAYERPQWCYPELAEDGTGPYFEVTGLQHPLIAPERCVANDLSFNTTERLLIVSGSNMSGKSTLLRAIGLNCVLAWAGAPVAAKSLRISALRLGASIRVSDSLLDNRSRFFAEISRLRQVVELTSNEASVLFLFDELLSGTNSHDRLIGATAIVTRLIRDGAIGLVTTHDLALAGIQAQLGSKAKNVHLDDRIIDGQVEFNYKLQPGLVTHSNALELMRAVGLEV